MAVEEFVNKTLDLVDKEREAEIQETQFFTERLSAKELERKGVCLLKLQLTSRRSGLYGRMVAVFKRQLRQGAIPELPSHNMSPGDIIGVGLMRSEATDKPLATGIVSQVSASSISIAFDESQDIFELDDDELFKLTKLANDVTYRRLKQTLTDLSKYRSGPAQRLIDTLFCLEEISAPSGDFPITFVNKSLDESQQEAVRFALTQREVAIVHGPPGTGKTTTVVELIIQAVRQGLKVLATASSNIAVDNLVERLANYKQRIIRIGHPARLLTHLQKYSLDAVVSGSEETGIVKDVKADIQKILTKLKKARGHGERHALREEMKQLRKEATKREEAATRDVLSRADVVLVTLTSATSDGPLKHMKEDHFDLVVIDECSQALEAACWIGLMRAPRCVLAGDHLQLPPTILSREAAAAGLEVTLMERLLKTLSEEKGKDVVRMLTTQYRMHEHIMSWSSQQLYQGKLTAHESVATHLLRDLNDVDDCEETCSPLLMIDTAGCDLYELELPEEVSKGNEGEADIVAAHVEDLIKSGVKPVDIAVIAPYNMQVDLLRIRLCSKHPDLEVKSVDGFQGREKEAVVISMVRSNPMGEVGFLAEKRRINVAVTRARRHLAVICDSETVSHDPFIKTLIDYLSEKGEVLSAHQYIQEGKVNHISNRPASLMNLMDSKEAKKPKAKKQEKKRDVEPLMTKEEKMKIYQTQLEKFVKDSSQSVLDFPPSLNSHDRMVIHEVADKMGLSHTSIGEGKERHIQVSKVKLEKESSLDAKHFGEEVKDPGSSSENASTTESSNKSGSDKETYRIPESYKDGPSISSHCDEELSKAEEINNITKTEEVSVSDKRQGFHKEKMRADEEAKSNENGSGASSRKIKSENLSINENEKENENSGMKNTEDKNIIICQYCQEKIPKTNSALHELHCAKQKQSVSNVTDKEQGGGGARKKTVKERKSEKQKPKISHVQKAADVLSKIDGDDFDALIASITELDSKCAFKKCKTLTNTLGRNCEHCTRRFCLTHLMPEVHGCGQAAKDTARRIISRDGVLHGGSGVPNRKPNQARRAQLENKMEKKLGELADKRNRKSDNKKS